MKKNKLINSTFPSRNRGKLKIRLALPRSVSSFFIFITTPKEAPPAEEASQTVAWFGLKSFIESDILAVKALGWTAVISLSIAIFLAVSLSVSRLTMLWDLWFEGIRLPDRESGIYRFLRILSFWLAVLGIASWSFCKILT